MPGLQLGYFLQRLRDGVFLVGHYLYGLHLTLRYLFDLSDHLPILLEPVLLQRG